jgi:hypothetical protein
VALLALQWKVTLEELKVDPGAGLSICAGPLPGVGVGAGVALGVGVGVGVGVDVGVCVGWKARRKNPPRVAKVVRTPSGVNL